MQTPIFRGYITKKNAKSYDLTFNIWCTLRTHIRTFLRFHGFPESDRFRTFLIIKGNEDLIIVEIDGIDEGVHQCLPLLRLGHIQLAEAKQPKADELFFHLRLGKPFLCNAGLQFFSLIFQSFQPFLGRAGQNAHLDGIQHIGDTDFRFLQLLFVDGQIRAFLILQLHDLGNDGIHGSVIFHQLHGFVDHQIFQPLFPHGLFIAGLFLLGGGAFIIVVYSAGVTDTAFPEHQCATLAAVQLGGQQIAFLCFMTGRGLFIFRQLLLHLVKQFLRYQRRNRIGLYYIPQAQFADIPPAAQHPLNRVVAHLAAGRVLDTLLFQPALNLCHGCAICVFLENLLHIRPRQRVRLIVPGLVNHVPKRNFPAIIHTFQRVFGHSPNDLFGQVRRIILGIAFQNGFQNDTLRASRNDFRSRHQLHTIAFQLGLVPGTVVTVPGKAVEFPDDNNIKDSSFAVLDHLLELRAVIRLGRDGTVYVMLDHRKVVLLSIGGAFSNLTLDGFFTLAVSGITGIDHGGHGKHLSLHITEWGKRSFKALFRIMYIPCFDREIKTI